MRAPSTPSLPSRARPLLVKLVSSERCQSLWMLGTGSQMRVLPTGSANSTRVVISKVRQAPGWGAKRRSVVWACTPRGLAKSAARGALNEAPNAAPPLSKERRTGIMSGTPK
jgi:hypothetical protein